MWKGDRYELRWYRGLITDSPVAMSLLVTAGLLFAACGGSRQAVEPSFKPSVVAVPAGVDSTVAADADSIARISFVDVDREVRALEWQERAQAMIDDSDSLFKLLEMAGRGIDTLAVRDSTGSQDLLDSGGRSLIDLDGLLRDPNLKASDLSERSAALLDSAEAALEMAFQLNPLDPRSRLWLARVYELQARRLERIAAFGRAIEELEKLVRLVPDQHTAFAMLANNYYATERWDLAALNYGRAEKVYLDTYDLALEGSVKVDTVLLFSYTRAQGDIHILRRDATEAVAAFDRAKRLAPTEDDRRYVEREREWMSWDDMNLSSSFARDSLISMEQSGDLTKARAGYVALLPSLQKQRAKDEIEWRLAIVDYKMGSSDQAVGRLRRLVERTVGSTTETDADSMHVRFINDYGTLCLNLGREYLHQRRDNRTALKYFEQATQLPWSGRATAFLESAALLQTNVDAAIERAKEALARVSDLTTEEKKNLYRLLMGLHRRAGDFEEARRYRDAFRSI